MGREREELLGALRRLELVEPGESPRFESLGGGVSSDIWRVEVAKGSICVKRALERLKVEADWRVPVERNANEVAWMQIARDIVPGCVPAILGHDQHAGLFAMEYIHPATNPVWKEELRDGRIDPGFSAQVGDRLG
jgi:5-methylthioribose kinase